MPTRLQVLIPIGIAAVIVGVAGIVSLPSEITIDANSNFLMGTVQLDDKILQVYIADTDPRRMRGLMFETESFLADDKGMLFVFDEPGSRSMWMKNMQFHLDIIWFNENGNVVSWSSAGAKGFKGSRKSTPYAAQVAADAAGSKAYEQGLRTLTVQVKGPGSGRETALRSLQSKGFRILSIKDTTPMPHNGARPPKRRRV